jgi:trans-aconitate methyltransferase
MDLNELPDHSAFARHPWELVRARFFAGVLDSVLDGTPARLLDAGAGDGWFSSQLVARYPRLAVTCFDPGYAEIGTEALPHADRVEFVATQPTGPFDVLTLLDVLEHVEDDLDLLSRLTATVRPGGHLLMSVPAWPVLFSRHDVALRHYRRYTDRRFGALLRGVGLQIVERGGLFHTLLVPRGVSVALERVRSGPAATPDHERALEWRGGRVSHRVLEAALTADTRLSRYAAARGWRIPGLTCWALCRRPSS